MILSAFGLPDYSMVQVSEFLRLLCMSHSLEAPHLSTVVDGLSVEQPVWPVVVSGVRSVPRLRTQIDRQVLFVCDCQSALATANLKRDLWPEHRGVDTLDKIKRVLVASAKCTGGWTLST